MMAMKGGESCPISMIETRNTIARRLPAHDWQAAWNHGRAMGLKQSIDYARLIDLSEDDS